MPNVYMLIGIPGSGKSTWVNNQDWINDVNVVYASSDQYIEEYAKWEGKTYNDVFDEYIKTATRKMNEDIEHAVSKGLDVVIDQTNVSRRRRKQKLKYFPGYSTRALVFKTPDDSELERRLSARPGKIIPKHIIDSMKNNLQYPTPDEGFDTVTYIEN